jgi:hypothetical protein
MFKEHTFLGWFNNQQQVLEMNIQQALKLRARQTELGMLAHACNPKTWEVDAREGSMDG